MRHRDRDRHSRRTRSAVVVSRGAGEDAPTTGAKTLAELIGEHGELFVASLRKIWDAEGASATKSLIDKLNEKHAVLFDQGGNFIVITETTEDGRPQVRFSDSPTMSKLYPQPVQVGVTSKGKAITKSLGAAWLEDANRRFYSFAASRNG